jgi:hypothetical protein
MNLLFLFEGIFFSCIYSVTPFVVSDIIAKPIFHFKNFETDEQKTVRYIFVFLISFLFFFFYTKSGYRTRYMIWHLERRRLASGFTPIETAAVSMYHSVILCLTTETILPLIDPLRPVVLSSIWLDDLGFRMKNIFFLSILQHALLEMSGFWNKIRREYFEVDRI